MTNRLGFVGMLWISGATVACASSAGGAATESIAAESDAISVGSPIAAGAPPGASEASSRSNDDYADEVASASSSAPAEDAQLEDLRDPTEPSLPGRAPIEELATDCPASDDAGRLLWKAQNRKMFDAHLSYRQTNDAGQSLAAACNLRSHEVTSQGMVNVPLHCTGRSQAQMRYARVGAAWGTRQGSPSCTKNICAAIFVRDAKGGLRPVVHGIHLADRFFCSQTSERNDQRLDVDACTYAEVVGALKHTGPTDDQSNLEYDAHWKLTGNPRTGERLRYEIYECDAGPSGPSACHDKPTPGYTCAQQRGWGKCGASWMIDGGYCAHTCGRC